MLAAAGVMFAASMAGAQAPQREFCADRPGLDTPPCTLAPGRIQVETGALDFTHDRNADGTTDTLLAGDTLVRIGLGEHVEGQVAWTPYGHVRMRDAATGIVSNTSRVGDVTLAMRRNLRNPDGSGASLAVMPYVTLPVGRAPIGAGDWGTGLLVPMAFDLGGPLHLALTPEVDAAVDEDGHGRHLAYGSMAGLGIDLTDALNLTVEAEALRDRDPSGHGTVANAAVSLAWQRGENTQFDIGAVAGLNRHSPDGQVYIGVARRF
ncbi:transporter [Sphingomonas sp. XMGL2]|uniref:Transporter n=2 Tax=Sphingomonas quercus TaxID=2842451 RepID=A0ABS6BEH1_9SPHN|nr:transporter [Sphingomonas quercus]